MNGERGRGNGSFPVASRNRPRLGGATVGADPVCLRMQSINRGFYRGQTGSRKSTLLRPWSECGDLRESTRTDGFVGVPPERDDVKIPPRAQYELSSSRKSLSTLRNRSRCDKKNNENGPHILADGGPLFVEV